MKGFPESENLRVLQLDVTDSEVAIKAVVADAIAVWGCIDVLVNNAGIGVPALLEEGGVEVLRRHYDTNVYGVLNVTLAVLPYMRSRRSGTIVVIGSRSALGLQGLRFIFLVKGSRARSVVLARVLDVSVPHTHALVIAETLAVEIAPFSIRVLIVEPGSFRTEGIYSNPGFEDNPISCYDDMRGKVYARHAYYGVNGVGLGDPAKAMDVLVDVVNGEGLAKGRPWPLYLVLGRDAEHDVRQKCSRIVNVLDEWTDVARCVERTSHY